MGNWKRPERFGRGKTMTFAEYGEYRVWRDGVLDVGWILDGLSAALLPGAVRLRALVRRFLRGFSGNGAVQSRCHNQMKHGPPCVDE